ncbi:HipA-related protein kinase, putative [Syntrophotalea carbinolica DSM 2380]|uniref:HipA-related protein kinase, putative n=1 Tax=Syntrophotalea carbinolica (strain DSM 2380 / NBRC 103641 / GraBd1) TaxID=338963 RepID=Q3A782_SYNC1|nr:HipA domain-containing protein [Syntrophotalea carbinolica]ABA87762.1 HipA-related protein kinase, putative [Syntrophotalea carbinolica DSM 2380]
MDEVSVEMYVKGEWRKVADFGVYGKNYGAGYHSKCHLSYDIDYVLSRMEEDRIVDRVGCRYPINFDLYEADSWPAFLLDLLPTGAAREAWLKMLGIRDDTSSWWQLLRFATGNPPGNLRIAGAAVKAKAHPGFEKKMVIEKNVDFIEYAEANGALVAGASDVQGQAPKFLLVEDRNERWHAEGAIPEDRVKCYWLVKFPRGKTAADRLVLRNEAPYYEVARAFGLRTAAPLKYEDGALFVRRFDRRVTQGGVERFGLESMTSVCGISEFGLRGSHNEACKMIHRYATEPRKEIPEYIKRDILNVALRNTDNHGRNTAFLKSPLGVVTLSPLFDFAPMFKDPEGIARAYRWDAEGEMEIGLPDWGYVAEALEKEVDIDSKQLRSWLADCASEVEDLPDTMVRCGVEESLVDDLSRRIQQVAQKLKEARPAQ